MDVVIGRIGRAHGVRGEVSVDVRTDEPERRFVVGASLTAEPSDRTLVVRTVRSHQGRLLVCFDGVGDRTAAEALRGAMLSVEVDPADVPDDPEEFYDHQLVGLAVRTVGGSDVGAVAQVVHLPAQDALEIRTTDGREVLVPFVEALVPTVDVTDGIVVVDDVRGLLDPDAAESAAPTADARPSLSAPGSEAE
ncbi:ribosome maturation factor RimM [Solicola gregarius]|uniref:Ribosome maturation factor RimM n=1 Tax=Solicola gregarius TaxID=2908642 RepID=A0AA46YJJ5_9ACTN|nr:ribosome maturation factor RimM [Solicola gregarius]UYM04407.1 ribosome maturation factor RimM [Solicola gregarius]